LIRSKTKEVYPQVNVSIIKSKDEDNRILECALESKVDYLISGDKRHILPLKEFKGIRIVSVSEFLDKYQGTAP
jgi:predicted nucleic acid-binding protein